MKKFIFAVSVFIFASNVYAEDFSDNAELKLRYKDKKFQLYSSVAGGRAEKTLWESSDRPSPALSLALERLNFAIKNQMLKKIDKFDVKSLTDLGEKFSSTATSKASSNLVYTKALESRVISCDIERLNLEVGSSVPSQQEKYNSIK